MTSPAADSRKTPIILAILLVLFFFANLITFFDFTEDDAAIGFRYAAHLFDGKGLTYNPAERVEGYSNFGYIVLVGIFYKVSSIFGDPRPYMIWIAKLINLVAGLIALRFCYRFSREILKKDRYLAFLTTILVAANGAFMINVASPMETATYCALLMAAMYYLARYLAQPEPRPIPRVLLVPTVPLILLSLWRIDAPVLVLALGLSFALARKFRFRKHDFVILAGIVVVFAAYTAFRYAYFGEVFNNPFHSKVNLSFASPIESAYTNVYFSHLGDNAVLFLLLFLLALAIDHEKYLAPFVLVAAQWLYLCIIGGDWMTGFRFWAPLTPCICILLVGVVDVPFTRLSDGMQKALKTLIIVCLAAWWFNSGRAIYQLGARTPYSFIHNFGKKSLVEANRYWATAKWMNENVRKDAVIVVAEGGFIPFLTDLHTIDTYGLCNYELARIEGLRGGLGLKITWELDQPGSRYIASLRPDILVLGPGPRSNNPDTVWDDWHYAATTPSGRMHIYVRSGSDALMLDRKE
ncbi:hypothetical protein ACFLQU_03380 [Verrucomicrobiota bacterium]